MYLAQIAVVADVKPGRLPPAWMRQTKSACSGRLGRSREFHLRIPDRHIPSGCRVLGGRSCAGGLRRPCWSTCAQKAIPGRIAARPPAYAAFPRRSLQSRVRPEKDRAMITIDTGYAESLVREEEGHFGPDQTARTRYECFWHGGFVLRRPSALGADRFSRHTENRGMRRDALENHCPGAYGGVLTHSCSSQNAGVAGNMRALTHAGETQNH